MANNPFRKSFLPVVKDISGTGRYASLDAFFGAGIPASWLGGNLFDLMRTKPGANHPWVYAAITTMLDAYVQCPLRMRNKNDPKGELIDEHPVLKLLSAPNPHMSGTNFLEVIVWALDLTTPRTQGGQCFLWGDECNFRKGQIPGELWLQNDMGVKPILNDQDILQAWELNFIKGSSPYNYGQNMRLELQEVIRVNNLNPYNLLMGLAPGQAVRVGVDQDASAAELNGAMITNGGQSKGVYTAKKPMTEKQLLEFKASLDKFYSGASNAGKDKYLPWEMDYNPLTISPKDMEYSELRNSSMEQIIAAHKVSKFAVQKYEDLNYATAKEAKRQLFEQGIIPINSRIMQEINQAWISNIGKGDLELCVDMSGVAALQDDMDARWKRAQIAVEMGIPPMAALKMNDIQTDDLRAFKWLMENQGPTAALPAAPVDANNPEKKPATPGKFYNIKAKLTADEKRAVCNEYISKVFDPAEKPMDAGVKFFLNKQRNRQLDKVDAWYAAHPQKPAKAMGKADEGEPEYPDVSDLMLRAKTENALLAAMMYPHYQAVTRFSEEYAIAKIEAVRMHPVQIDIKGATETFLQKRLRSLSEVNNTTFKGVEDKLAAVLADARANEFSNQETAKAIRESIQETYAGRVSDSMRIARTETGVVSGFVQFQAGVDAGMERKGWLDTEDEKTRATHVAAHDEGPIPFDQPFSNGLQHPGDPAGAAKEVIRCRCAIQFYGPA